MTARKKMTAGQLRQERERREKLREERNEREQEKPTPTPEPVLPIATAISTTESLHFKNDGYVTANLTHLPPNKWKLTMVPSFHFISPGAPSRFHRWTLGLIFGFKWERLP